MPDARFRGFEMEGMMNMTVRQEAYSWIDRLPDESVRAVIQVMKRMVPSDAARHGAGKSSKLRAFERMQQLRAESPACDISEAQRSAAVSEKFGTVFPHGGAE